MTTKATRDVLDLAVRPVTNVDIDGGSLDGTPIGVTTPDVGFFTNLTTNNLTVTNSIDLSAASVVGTVNAYYADIAEYYHADAIYAPGTVLALGGVNEVTVATDGEDILSVVSTAPAIVLNNGENDLDTPVVLKGRVPVRVIGPVKKFDHLVLSNIPGVAMAYDGGSGVTIGRALSSSDEDGEHLVEAVVSINI